MSILAQIDAYRLDKLREVLSQCGKQEQAVFWLMYGRFGGGIEDIPKSKLDWAIQQCERTVAKSKLGG